MSEKHGALRIHTHMTPETASGPRLSADPPPGVSRRRARRGKRPARRPDRGDRLLRNSAIACAVLLGALALGNVNQPWARKAAEGIERALTMHINLDDSIGELTFVRQIMPESALVFLNTAGGAALTMPVDGEIRHPWSDMQPWLMFDCGAGAEVYAVGAGTVTAVSALSGGRYGLLVDHGEGFEAVYANLSEVSVRSGDTVERGQPLGIASDSLYFEARSDGEPFDPGERLGLK